MGTSVGLCPACPGPQQSLLIGPREEAGRGVVLLRGSHCKAGVFSSSTPGTVDGDEDWVAWDELVHGKSAEL